MEYKKWGKKIFALVQISIMLACSIHNTVFALEKEECSVYRLSGADRYETSTVISREGWRESEFIVLASGEKFSDALAGSPIAYGLNAPLLLTESHKLNTCVKEEIIRLNAKNVVLLGGPGAVAPEVEKELSEMGIEVERLWGGDRYETSLEIGEKIWTDTPFSQVFITTGEEFQYAMMIAPLASKNHVPILFTTSNKLNERVKKTLEKWGITEAHIIGDKQVIGEAVKEELEGMGIKVRRIGGDNIQETNINVIRRYYTSKNRIGVAREDVFADALAGCSFAALEDMPILLTNKVCPSPTTESFLNKYEFDSAYIFGGKDAVSDYAICLIKKQNPIVACDAIPIEDALKSDGQKVAFLTFDDGPSKNVTPAVLDILEEYDIKATFFIVGQMAKNNEDVVKRIFSEGHSIGNHSYSHEYRYLYKNAGNFMGEINKWEETLKKILGEEFATKLFRFPGGSFGNKHATYKEALKDEGYNYINWNALTGDSEGHNISEGKLIKRLKNTVSGKDRVVILMHDLGSKKTTVEALPDIIEYLKSEGYVFKRLI